jgi:hypothetical protein
LYENCPSSQFSSRLWLLRINGLVVESIPEPLSNDLKVFEISIEGLTKFPAIPYSMMHLKISELMIELPYNLPTSLKEFLSTHKFDSFSLFLFFPSK